MTDRQHVVELLDRLDPSQVAAVVQLLEDAEQVVPPYCIEWLDEAKADVRRLDRPTALRLGDDRVLFTLHDDAMRIFGVRHRSAAYG